MDHQVFMICWLLSFIQNWTRIVQKKPALHKKGSSLLKIYFLSAKNWICSNLLKKTLTEKLFFLCSAGFGFHQPQKPCKEPKTALVKHAE